MKKFTNYIAVCCILLFMTSLASHWLSAKVDSKIEKTTGEEPEKKQTLQLQTSDLSFQFVQFWIGRTSSHILFTLCFYAKISTAKNLSYTSLFELEYYIQLFKSIIVKNAP